MDESVAARLAVHPFTADLSDEARQLLADLASLRAFEPGELLIEQGQLATTFYLITGGLAAIELFLPGGGVRRLQTVEAGSAVGWSWMLPPSSWEFDARAIVRTEAIALDAAGLRELLSEDCCLGFQLMQRLLVVVAQRLTAARLQLLDLYGPPQGARR